MPSTPDRSDTVIHASPSADPGLCSPKDALETKAPDEQEVSPPLPIISKHRVILGTAAATAAPPSMGGELDSEEAAPEGQDAAAESPAAPGRTGWIATLVRLVTPSRDRRPRRQHYPTRLDSEFIADARMDREMYRL